MYTKFAWLVAVLFALMLNQTAFADSLCREGLNKMVQSLNLDDNQKAKIKPIIDQLKTNLKASGSQMGDLESQLNQQVNSPSMDQATVDSLVDKKTKLIGDMMKAKITAKNQIFSILNDQQKTKLQGIMKKAEDKIAAEFKNCEED